MRSIPRRWHAAFALVALFPAHGAFADPATLDLPMQVLERGQPPAVPPTQEDDERSRPRTDLLAGASTRDKTGPEYPAAVPMPVADPVAQPGLVERTLLDVNQTLNSVSQSARNALGVVAP